MFRNFVKETCPINFLQSFKRQRIEISGEQGAQVDIEQSHNFIRGQCDRLSGKTNHVILLQGPVGPFFKELHIALSKIGLEVTRMIFNEGDRFFSSGLNCIRFSGSLTDWEKSFRIECLSKRPDLIILFGSSRPAHVMARQIACELGIRVLSLEEGYLRSGYITAEIGGNNQHSPFSKWKPKLCTSASDSSSSSFKPSNGPTWVKSFWAAVYYAVRDLFSTSSDSELFHRKREQIFSLAWSWGWHVFRRQLALVTESFTRWHLQQMGDVMLIPLQVSDDSQLKFAARGWNTHRLINSVLMAHVKSSTKPVLLFKLHPLERSSSDVRRYIFKQIKHYGIDRKKVKILNSGRMGNLSRCANGMIVINSTSAFSAMHNRIPLLVLGDAVFRHKEIVTLGNSDSDIQAFIEKPRVKSPFYAETFLLELKSNSLVSGDFYYSRGRKQAIKGIINKMRTRCTFAGALATRSTL